MKAIVHADMSAHAGGNSKTNYLMPGQSLKTNDRLVSANGLFQFINQGDGNVCLYDAKGNCNWASNTAQHKGEFKLEKNGELHLVDSKGKDLWSAHVANQGGAELYLQNNGNLVLYKSDGSVVWQTNTAEILPTYTRDSLYAHDRMVPGDILLSPNKHFLFQLRTDGMLILHDANGVTQWNSDAYPTAAYLSMNSAGNLILNDAQGNNLWWALNATSDSTKNSFLKMQDDGNLVLYTPKGLATWNTQTVIAPTVQSAMNPIPVDTTSSCGVVVDSTPGAAATSICGGVIVGVSGCGAVLSGIGMCGAVYSGASFCGVVGNGVSACGADFSTFGICGVVAAAGGAAVASVTAVGACGAVVAVAGICGAVLSGAGSTAIGATGASVCGTVTCGAAACGADVEGAGACAEASGTGVCGANATVGQGAGVCGAQAGFCGAVLCVAFPIGGNW